MLKRLAKKHVIVVVIAIILTSGVVGASMYDNTELQDEPQNNVETKSEVSEIKVSTAPVAEEAPPAVEVTNQPQQEEPATNPEPPINNNPYSENTSTWYVFEKRIEAGKSIGTWGFPHSWVNIARANGIAVDNNPQYGDILVIGQVPYFVDGVSEETINVSTILGGLQSQNISTEEASLKRYLFIH